MANLTRTHSKNVVIGVTLLALAGSLLAVDVGATRATDAGQPLPVLAEATPPVAPPAVSLPPRRPVERTTFATLIVRKVERRNEDARRRPQIREPIVASHPIVHKAPREVHVTPRVPRAVIVEGTSSHAKAVPQTFVVQSARVRIVARIAAAAAPRATGRPAIGVTTEPGATRRPGRSAVEAAQFFAVRTVEAQNRGVEHIAAVTHTRGVGRLVVYIIAKTHAGTLVEYEVLRRNGIGFAIESTTSRFVALSPRAKAARNSPAGRA